MTPFGRALASAFQLLTLGEGELQPSVDRRVRIIAQAARLAGAEPAAVVALCALASGLRVHDRDAPLCRCASSAADDGSQAVCAARSYAAAFRRCGSPSGAAAFRLWGQCAVRGPDGRRALHEWESLVDALRRDEATQAEAVSYDATGAPAPPR